MPWLDNVHYFLTTSTFLHYPYFDDIEKKEIVWREFAHIRNILHIPFSAYSIACNHFHIKFFLPKGVSLAKVKQLLHGGISFAYRKKFKTVYDEMWQSTKTLLITSEEMDWKVTGYIIGNLLKHKEVNTFYELRDNKYSSYRFTAEKYGESMAKALVRSVIVANEDAEGVVDLQELKQVFAPCA